MNKEIQRGNIYAVPSSLEEVQGNIYIKYIIEAYAIAKPRVLSQEPKKGEDMAQ